MTGMRQLGRAPRRPWCLLCCALVSVLVRISPVLAIQASPHVIRVRQPDGAVVRLHIRGDEYFHWQEDLAGYTVMRDRGRYVYARRGSDGRLAATPWEVGRTNPAAHGLERRILPAPGIIEQRRAAALAGSENATTSAVGAAAVSGTVKNLVILVRFSDHADRTLPGSSDIEVLFNAPAPDPLLAPTGSLRAFYLENSYGQLTLDSTVVGWIDVPKTEAYYADGQSGLTSRIWQALESALDQADAVIDFSDFDADGDGYIDSIAFIHSGYGAEWGGVDADGASYEDRIWSHRWEIQPAWTSTTGVKVSDYHISPGLWGLSGSAIGHVGVIAHETGHFFGLPDLYDPDASPGEGIGSWGLMANSWGFDFSQRYPPHLSAWSKIALGWVSSTPVTSYGTYTVADAENNPVSYRLDTGFPPGEYLLIENRQPLGFDGDMPQGGLAVWHIDEAADDTSEGYPGQAGWPANGNHYRVALLQADGNYDLERGNNRGDGGDVYHGNAVSRIGPDTVPDTAAYQQGVVRETGINLVSIGLSGSPMSFTYGPPATYHLRPERFEADWIDATGGSRYTLADDGSVALPVGFDFDFYGTAQTVMTVSANGYLTFGPDGATGGNTALPDPAAPNNLIAPLWDDLDPGQGGAVYVLRQGVAPYRRTTVAWIDVAHAAGGGAATFEATLYEYGGDIVFRYLDVDFGAPAYDQGASATIGVEDPGGADATQYSFNVPALAGGDALRFSTRKDVLLVDDDDDAPDVVSLYTTPLAELGATYDIVEGASAEPDAATLAGYKSVIWFSGAKWGADAAGPGPAGEAALGAYLDSGACLFISSQDYYFDHGLTAFMVDYLGVASAAEGQWQTDITGSSADFYGLGPYTPSFLFTNYSDILVPDAATSVAFTADEGSVALARTTPTYATTFWGFPLELIPDAAERRRALDAALRFCANVGIDTDADGSANASDPDDDNDTLSDVLEVTVLGTDPRRADSDGDGYGDAAEQAAGSDPLDAGSIPANTGDINSDGRVDIVDVLLGTRRLLELRDFTPDELLRADVAPVIDGISTPDGQFTAGDQSLIEQKALGLSVGF